MTKWALLIGWSKAVAAPPAVDVVVHGEKFEPVAAFGVVDPSRPGTLTVVAVPHPWTCADARATKQIEGAALIAVFGSVGDGAVATDVLPLPKPFGMEWKGAATLTTVPHKAAEIGTVTLAFEGKDHATGALSFQLCDDLIPYVPPSSTWTPTDVDLTIPGMFPSSPVKSMKVRMPFPTEWTSDPPQEGVEPSLSWTAQDGRTRLWIKFDDALWTDAKAEFTAYADEQISKFAQYAVVTEHARSFDGEVGVLDWTRFPKRGGPNRNVEVIVQRPGFEQRVHCVYYVAPGAEAIVPGAIAACAAIQRR